MFIRWKKQGNKKYATLEERHLKDGKVKTKLVAYLGAHPQARLAALVEAGTITHEEHDRLAAKLPEIPEFPEPPKPPKLPELPPASVERNQADILLKKLMAELDGLTERDIMKEFPDLSSHMAHVDGVKYMLKKLEVIKERYSAYLGDESPVQTVHIGKENALVDENQYELRRPDFTDQEKEDIAYMEQFCKAVDEAYCLIEGRGIEMLKAWGRWRRKLSNVEVVNELPGRVEDIIDLLREKLPGIIGELKRTSPIKNEVDGYIVRGQLPSGEQIKASEKARRTKRASHEEHVKKSNKPDEHKKPISQRKIHRTHQYIEAVRKYPDLATLPETRAIKEARERGKKLSSSPIPL